NDIIKIIIIAKVMYAIGNIFFNAFPYFNISVPYAISHQEDQKFNNLLHLSFSKNIFQVVRIFNHLE
ncbi:MAG: hypothetical protein KDK96_09595, partial [Chlamydiia bacterium]|nr:hypothetical protein [Chlamydiia bacterium]